MVSNESLDIAISGPPSTAVSLTVPTSPFGAAWFTSGSSLTTDSQGEAQTTLYLAGMWVNPHVQSNYTVQLEVVTSGASGVSLGLPVVESSTVTGLNPVSAIALPANLLIEPANNSNGISYRTPFGVVYLPTSSSPANLNLSMSVIGLASGKATSPGSIQTMPSWLNVWFADGQGVKESSLTLAPYKIQFIFLTSNTMMDFPPNTLKFYNVAIQFTENGTSFTEATRVIIQSPISTGGPASSTSPPSTATASVSNSSDGLSLNLQVLPGGNGTFTVTAYESNLLGSVNNVTEANQWKYPADLLNPANNCAPTNDPVGFAIFQGYYGMSNYTSGNALPLYNTNVEFHCTENIYANEYVFQPMSESISVYNHGQFETNGTASVSLLIGGYWTGGAGTPTAASFNEFRDVYTVLAADEWGNVLLLHFTVD